MTVSATRLTLATLRIRRALRKHFFASEKMLESKIAEAGPFNQRCNPHVVSQALTNMVNSREVLVELGPNNEGKFYYLANFFDTSKAAHVRRREEVLNLYKEYRLLTFQRKPNVCGDALESIIWKALSDTDCFLPLGKQGAPLSVFGNIVLPGHLDIVLVSKTTPPFAALIEAKNIREWLYPSSVELWQLIHKSLVFLEAGYPTVPIIVCRKIQYSTRLLFKKIGLLGAETHRQYFSPTVESRLEGIKHKDGLGFHDISCSESPPKWLAPFFGKTVTRLAGDCSSTFQSRSDVLLRHAEILSSNLSGSQRIRQWKSFCSDLAHDHEYSEDLTEDEVDYTGAEDSFDDFN
ncbi:MAG: hypothetical protein K2X81_17915 [Candidatus Obscuribacterales bacterium]|nr:hypothetical protein [Candidatus Obscuribacterales bacterium]